MADHPQRRHGDVLREAVSLAGVRVLDIGCGDGSLARSMARQGARATGLEISEEKLARARAAPPAGDETYRVGRGESLPFGDGCFGLVVFFNSLHHVPLEHHEAALGEAARVLIAGGLLYVLEPLAEGARFELLRPVEDETEVRAAAYRAIRQAVARGIFSEEQEYTYESPLDYTSFEAFKDAMLAVDGRRRLAFEAQEPALRTRFEETAERHEGAYRFTHPSRLNLLRKI
jgi:ubiquinone/menaquinone biosynthesis C-methylase UbiE